GREPSPGPDRRRRDRTPDGNFLPGHPPPGKAAGDARPVRSRERAGSPPRELKEQLSRRAGRDRPSPRTRRETKTDVRFYSELRPRGLRGPGPEAGGLR